VSRPESGGPEPAAPPPQGVEIRPAVPADARGWIEHVARVAGERRYIRTEVVRWSAREMRRRFRRSWTTARAYLIAEADGGVIGTLGIEREGNPVLHHVASLGMSVDEGWRGKGVGAALLSEAFRWARWAGVEKVALTVYPRNQRAINLYKRFGFEEEGRLVGHSKKSYGYEDEIVMGRWL
jgi:RimJ/RimL family protein N-acetyltransferase